MFTNDDIRALSLWQKSVNTLGYLGNCTIQLNPNLHAQQMGLKENVIAVFSLENIAIGNLLTSVYAVLGYYIAGVTCLFCSDCHLQVMGCRSNRYAINSRVFMT